MRWTACVCSLWGFWLPWTGEDAGKCIAGALSGHSLLGCSKALNLRYCRPLSAPSALRDIQKPCLGICTKFTLSVFQFQGARLMGRRKSCSHPSSSLESWEGQAFHIPLSNQPATNSCPDEIQRINMEEGKTRSMSWHKSSFVTTLEIKILTEFC